MTPATLLGVSPESTGRDVELGMETNLAARRFDAPKPFPARGEYVSPGLKTIYPDFAFPHMTLGNTDTCGWAHLRRAFPHNWYVDERHTGIGFLSRDEAHILYNTALFFAGQDALEIGCWMGWSACHLALGGVRLDVVDPMLDHEIVGPSVRDSLARAGLGQQVRLYGGYSPGRVEELAREENRRWSLIFIDGDHEGRAPVDDAIVCDRYAAEDALILLHDLASPDVAAALDWLQDAGWSTMVYHTMQIMGVAWRGKTRPVPHKLDPRVHSELPVHLRRHALSGAGTVSSTRARPIAHTTRSVATLNVTTPAGRKTVTLELDPSDPFHGRMLEPFATGQLYAPAVANMLAAALVPGSTFVELGTGVGYFSILAALRVGETGKVIAVPDSARNTASLAGNLKRAELGCVSMLRLPGGLIGRGAAATEVADTLGGKLGQLSASVPRGVMVGPLGELTADDLAVAVAAEIRPPVLIVRSSGEAASEGWAPFGYAQRSSAVVGPDCWQLYTRSG